MYELIISEKPQAAEKIANALADKGAMKVREKVNFFSLTHNGKQIRVCSAVGHLYGLGEKGGESWKYPVFDTEWKPTYKMNKAAAYTKDYIDIIKKLGKEATSVTVASDFDIEGEVIGLNVVLHALGLKDAQRMKFSTLTKNDLIKSYENKLPTLVWGQANAGVTRHNLDWYYGINLSRAFTDSIKKGAGQFKVMSTGRVQAPALHFLAERERKIAAFIPEKYSEIYMDGNCSDIDVNLHYELPKDKISERKAALIDELDEDGEDGKKVSVDKHKIFDEAHADLVVSETSGKNGKITEVSAKKFNQAVPLPFDLTSLQMEASNLFGYSPKRTLEIAQKLYIEGVTSYPRTSSQKLPSELNLKNVLDQLNKQSRYKDFVSMVLKVNPEIKPNEGKKEDPAHPAIHPTGEIPKSLDPVEMKVYDLVVKRFFAVFGEPAIKETNTIRVDVNSHNFILSGTRTIVKNWHELYAPYVKAKDVELPVLTEGDTVVNKEINKLDKETSPPKRYTDASIIKALEKRNLGTKATRADILENLKKRAFIVDKSIKVTELGLSMDEILSREVPMLVDEALTRQFEEEMEDVRLEKTTPERVLADARARLEIVLGDIKKKEVELGKQLATASKLAVFQAAKIAKCPSCEEGTLVLKKQKNGPQKFIACDKYPDCKTIFGAPNVPVIKGLEEDSVDENGKIWALGGKENQLKRFMVNPDKVALEDQEKKYDEQNMTCPTCNEGQMILRKSFYGEFLGCNNYPKCKTMMYIKAGVVDTTPVIPKPKVAKKKVPAKKKTDDSEKPVKKVAAKKKLVVKKTPAKKKVHE
jgi:DNA topoisomerase-1